MKAVALWLIHAYQNTLSRVLPLSCRFIPSCSEYTYQAIDKFGNVEDPPAAVTVVAVGGRFGMTGTGWYLAAGAGLLGLGVLTGLRARRRGS